METGFLRATVRKQMESCVCAFPRVTFNYFPSIPAACQCVRGIVCRTRTHIKVNRACEDVFKNQWVQLKN